MNTGKPYVIGLEEHYWDAGVPEPLGAGPYAENLRDIGTLRLAAMDGAGIDFQVLSHAVPGVQELNPETAVELAAEANNRLHEAATAHPARFAGFAMLPMPDPQAAAEELERTVTGFGFKGAMVAPLTHGRFLDDRQFWPIFESAESLDVPIYIHPYMPHPTVTETYYEPYARSYPAFATAAWGFGVETATQAIRLILAGVFDAFPRLKIILGHMGELLPFALCRIDERLANAGVRPGVSGSAANPVSFRECFCEHFYITTSGNFSTPALLCSILELGLDHVLFSVDWPFVKNEPAMDWMRTVPLSAEDKAKIYGGNARRLLKI